MKSPSQPQVVVITGASAGVGRAVARRFARHGARIGLIARGEERLRAAQAEVETAGGEAAWVSADVADPAAVERAAATFAARFGPPDVWVNNAMTTVFAPFSEIEPDEFRRATEVTYLGQVYGTMAALKRMRPRNRGVIVQVGSALAYRSIPLQSPYCGAKHAIRGFTDSLRCELIHERSRVRITMVQLPAMNTTQFSWCKTRLPRHPQPVPPIFQPEVAADAIVWAAHHHRREVRVGAPTWLAIVGNKLAPGILDRYLGATGYRSQQTDELVSGERPSNLFAPVPGNQGAHGIFDQRAHDSSLQLLATTHRSYDVAAGLALIGAGVVAGSLLGRRRAA